MAVCFNLGRRQSNPAGKSVPATLTETDLRCLQLAAEGVPVPRIAKTLGITPAEVREHFAAICAHFEARTLAQAIARAIRTGVIA